MSEQSGDISIERGIHRANSTYGINELDELIRARDVIERVPESRHQG